MNPSGPAETELDTWRWGREIPLLERLIFGRRWFLLCVFLSVTAGFAWQASLLKPDASFEKMIPMQHPYVQAMMRHIEALGATGTTIQIVVESRDGDIFDAAYLETVRKITDEVFYLPGVDRNRMRSLWTPNVRWMEVTEEGFEGDQLIGDDYDGSPQAMERLKANVLRSGELGRLIADDYRSSIVEAPLFDRDPRTGEPLDYRALSMALETRVRDRYQDQAIRIRIVGFAKMVGDLLEGIRAIVLFGAITLLVTAILLYLYARSLPAAGFVLLCSITAVIWQLGLLHVLGYGLNAFSILVPFLVFAIAVSHGVQILNSVAVNTAAVDTAAVDTVAEDTVAVNTVAVNTAAVNAGEQAAGQPDYVARSPLEAARLAFRSLYIPGSTALVSDAAGFLTMLLVPIQVIRDLGIAASVGVGVILLTNLVLLPIILSWRGLSPDCVSHLAARYSSRRPHWERLAHCARRPLALQLTGFAIVLAMLGLYFGQDLKIGDLDAGAPELRADSRYNRDSAYINAHYATSSDVLVIMVETPPNTCAEYRNMALIDEFTWVMQNVPGVESTLASSTVSRLVLSGYNEGSLKWATITRNQDMLNTTFNPMPPQLVDRECRLSPVIIFLADHRADTLARTLAAVEAFAAEHNSEAIRFVPAAGNAGIEAATNQEISGSRLQMLLLVYVVVGALVFFSFGSLRAVLCILAPLALTSILCQALMAELGIGVKVATLPVIALGVGVGVDYGIYIYARLLRCRKTADSLAEAYLATLYSTGKAVAFTGITLALGVATWMWSPIKFQADMGKLLTFMFLFNMVGALTLLPALAAIILPDTEEC